MKVDADTRYKQIDQGATSYFHTFFTHLSQIHKSMNLQAGLLSLVGLLCIAMLAVINLRKREESKTQSTLEFQQVQLNVMENIQSENQHQLRQAQSLLDKTKAQLKDLGSEISNLLAKKELWKSKTQTCKGEAKAIADEVAAINSERSNQRVYLKKEKAGWKVELNSLKQQVTQRTTVCNFVKKDNAEARALCEDKAPEANPKEKLHAKEKQEKQVETEE